MEGGANMHNKPQIKLIFIVFASCLFIFSPLLILLIPLFFPVTFFYEKYTWVYYIPSINHILTGIAIGLLFLACITVIIIKKFKIMLPIVSTLTIGAIVLIVGSSVSYLKITQDGMKFRYPFEMKENVYEWNELEKVEYYPILYGTGRATYDVTFKDGKSFEFSENGDVLLIRSKLKWVLFQHDISYRNMSTGHPIK